MKSRFGAGNRHFVSNSGDQVAFMRSMLNLATMEGRITACLSFEQASLKSGVRLDALRPLHYLFLSGAEIEREIGRAHV